MTVINILNNPQKLKVRFKLVAERARLAEERTAIRLRLTLAIIEDILKIKIVPRNYGDL